MRLRLGTVDHDLTTRALVIGVVDLAPPASGTNAPAAGGALFVRVEALVAEGADVLDLGGAGADVGEDEEQARLVGVVEAVRARFDVPLSIDTWRPGVLAAAAAAGAAVCTDRSGLAGATHLQAASQTDLAVVITHNRPPPADRSDILGQVQASLAEAVATARAMGVPDERMIVDAGLDQGKTPQQSLTLLRESAALADLGPPLLLDASNRRFLGLLLDLDVGERRVASHAAAALGIARGCRLVRSHDVRGARRVADVLSALLAARLAHVTAGIEADGG
jgi:dihydropteroate synthase